MYWRIIRINGDETIRLVYDGTKKSPNEIVHLSIIAVTEYNSVGSGDAKYVGYSYNVSDEDDTQVNSTIKTQVDMWYDKNLKIKYGQYIADSIFCNDKSFINEPDEYGFVNYSSFYRLKEKKSPILTCANQTDRYTVEDTTNGNSLLSNPVGLITADEVFYSGYSNQTNKYSYLYSGDSFWTSTPETFTEYGISYWVNTSTSFISGYENGVRPVINLKADVRFTGTGTIDDPYVIMTD